IANANELAGWLNAKVIKSDFRPVKLHEGVYYENKVWFEEKPHLEIVGDDVAEVLIAENTAIIGKQALIFAASRRNAEAIAEKCAKVVKKTLSKEEINALEELSKAVLESLEYPTPQCKRLSECIKQGSAFHHAGLVAKQRFLVEDAFRNKLIKIIAATPTLAAGVDLPAYRVIIRDARRYYPGSGFVFIPVLEYEQMRGRAGRPRYDKEGESVLLAHSEREARELYNRFVLGEPEQIQSKLAVEPVLRMHTLALIATNAVSSREELENFFAATFWGYQYKDIGLIKEKLLKIVKQLIKWNFIFETVNGLEATTIGKRISELYIDPSTAHEFIKAIQQNSANEFGLLQLISYSSELSPQLRVKKREYDFIMNELATRESKLMMPLPKEWDLEYEDFLDSVKTALAFEDWCNEIGEDWLYKKYSVTPGELHSKREIADWLLYAIGELARLIGKSEVSSMCRKLRIRMYYGVKEELLHLIKLKGIGRARARKLFQAGYKTIADLGKADTKQLAMVLGSIKLAESIKQQLNGSGAAQSF
ncbi:MAG: helicase-related protein, partial [Candidatus Nanoarchaeia archaeon]